MTTFNYPCGCTATGGGELPLYCPQHAPSRIAIAAGIRSDWVKENWEPIERILGSARKWLPKNLEARKTVAAE